MRLKEFLRQGYFGSLTCRIYDQYHVKRCNNCQSFGHYYKNCHTPDVHVCAKCSSNHQTRECQSEEHKCINCVKAGVPNEECNHCADDQRCPTLLNTQKKMKNNINRINLNM